MKPLRVVFIHGLVTFSLCTMAFAQGGPPYNIVWTTEPGDTAIGFSEESVNTVINNKMGLKAGFDFDADGNLEFVAALQSSNEVPIDNNLYLFENDGDNNYALRWSYKIENVQHQRNALAVGDLDEDGNSEIVWVLNQPSDQPNVLFFEYDPAAGSFPDQPTASWNSPRASSGEFRCEVDFKIEDIDNDGRQEMIMISFDGVVIASLSSTDFSSPQFIDEYSNFTEFEWTFATVITDLDNNGSKELVTMGAYGLGSFNILEAVAPGFYVPNVSMSLSDLPDGLGAYNAMTTADLDANGFPEIYYADTNGNFRSFATNGPLSPVTADNFNLLGSVQSEVLNIIARDNSFYVGTSHASEIFEIVYQGGDATDSLSYAFTEIFADTVSGAAGITIFRIDGATDLDGDDKIDIVFAAANHDSTRPTLYVLEAGSATAVTIAVPHLIPDEFVLQQNYPNPSNPTTSINFTLPLDKTISLKIYNSLGQEVRTLVDSQTYPQGPHSIQWDGRDDAGRNVASGIYVYELTFGNFSKAKMMTLTR